MRICLDLNIWCADVISRRKRNDATAARMLVDAVRRGACARGPLTLVISLGMLDRLTKVLVQDIGFGLREADDVVSSIAMLASPAPALTLGGVGVIALDDHEDRHVLETAWAGHADLLVTANVRDFEHADADILAADRIARLRRGDRIMLLAHPFAAAAWLDGRVVPGWP